METNRDVIIGLTPGNRHSFVTFDRMGGGYFLPRLVIIGKQKTHMLNKVIYVLDKS